MGEMKALMFSMFLFIAFMFPAILQFTIDTIHENAFMKYTKEFTEIVQEEAGSTAKTKEVKQHLTNKGYDIQLTNANGQVVTGTVSYGETITVTTKYKFKSVSKQRNLKAVDNVLVTRR